MDTRTRRTWFFKKEGNGKDWSSESVKPDERYKAIQREAKQKGQGYHIISRIILSHAPLTFGHSQLIIKFSSDKRQFGESERFAHAAEIIKNAISVFEKVLGSDEVHKKASFKKLAEITRTYNKYIKTLILRTSADEVNEQKNEEYTEYKIHLVPYFESQAFNCKSRYCTIHFLSTNEPGGLLGWLGERETEVDRWLKPPHPWAEQLDKIACEDWKMHVLAKLLCEKWSSKD